MITTYWGYIILHTYENGIEQQPLLVLILNCNYYFLYRIMQVVSIESNNDSRVYMNHNDPMMSTAGQTRNNIVMRVNSYFIRGQPNIC